METFVKLPKLLSKNLMSFKSLTPHGDGNSFKKKGKTAQSIQVLNLLPLTGMETCFKRFSQLVIFFRFKSLTPHGDGNFRLCFAIGDRVLRF